MKIRTFDPFYDGVIPLKQEGMTGAQVGIGQQGNPGKMEIGIFAQLKLSHRSSFVKF